MRRVAVLLSLVVASTAGAQGSFEGVVTYQMGNSGDTWQYSAKGGKVRMDMSNAKMPGGVSAIMDMSAMTTTVLMNQQHMYMTMPIPQSATIPDSIHGSVTKTGSEVIAGIPCDDYVGTDAKGAKSGTVCLAHGMGNFAQFGANNPLMRQYSARVSGFSGAMSGGGFPLKIVKEDGQTTMLATKVEKKSLDASLFSIPAGYTQMQMPAGMPQH
jgi:Domain of unknown function (DUF4412)